MTVKDRLIKAVSVLLIAASVFCLAACNKTSDPETAASEPIIPIPSTDGFTGCLTYLFYDLDGESLVAELEEYLQTYPL